MTTLEDKSLWEGDNTDQDDIGQDILRLAPEEITNRTRLLENDIKVRFERRVTKT
jgi:26S proteasome regulatory subunit T5